MKKTGEKFLCRGSWLSLKQLSYLTEAGTDLDWEVIVRSRRETVVVVLARLVPSGRWILIRQFRPGIGEAVLALPAGCVEPGVEIGEHAERELREETGYRGRLVSLSPRLKINPAVLDCDFYVAVMEVEEEAEDNRDPRQELEPEEEIEVILVEDGRIGELFAREAARGTAISAGCWLAFGFTAD